jgi:hypothetical protein
MGDVTTENRNSLISICINRFGHTFKHRSAGCRRRHAAVSTANRVQRGACRGSARRGLALVGAEGGWTGVNSMNETARVIGAIHPVVHLEEARAHLVWLRDHGTRVLAKES